jgi:hypothetical protein
MCVSNFVRIGRSIHGIQEFFEIQYGGRPPSWIPHNANFDVDLSTGIVFCLYLSNFVKFGLFVSQNIPFFSKCNMAVGIPQMPTA